MIQVFNFKIIKSGKQIEVYEYKTKNIVHGYIRKKRQPKKEIKRITTFLHYYMNLFFKIS